MSTSASRSPSPPADANGAAVLAQSVTDIAALERVRGEWEDLWSASPRATPFQSPRWLLPWWKHLGRGALATFALRCGATGELVGLAPLYVHRDHAGGRRHLFPLGIATSDCLDPLLRPGREPAALACLLAALQEHAGAWDVLEWPQLRPASPLLDAALPPGWRREVMPGEPSPWLPLPAAARSWPVPRAMAQNIRTARARLARAGSFAYEQPPADEFLGMLARLHGRRWNERGLPGVLGNAGVLAAHREAAPALHAAGMLRLFALRLDGECIAAAYCLADPAAREQRRWYYYLGGFDPRRAALSPGTLLIAHAIEHAQREGAAAFDFLRGAEAYKYRWGAIDQPMHTLRLWH